jgi:hypothetical protein
VIDQWGLNDRYVAHRKSTRFLRGHVKFAPIDYLQSRKVNLYIDHPIICSCTSPCRQPNPSVFVRLSDGSCLRTWYLTPTDQLTAYFCSHPKWFTLDHVRCPGAPNPAPATPPKAPTAPAPKPAAKKAPVHKPQRL